MLKINLLILLLFFISNVFAESATVIKTKEKIHEIDLKIRRLNLVLQNTHQRQKTLAQELKKTEGKIKISQEQGLALHKQLEQQQLNINHLQNDINQLNAQLRSQQEILAEQVRNRYKLGQAPAIKWLFTQDRNQFTRMMTWYQYLLHQRHKIIIDIQKTKENLVKNENTLQQEMLKQKNQQALLVQYQKQYREEKQYHQKLLLILNQDVIKTEKKISSFQDNRDNLNRLLRSLMEQSLPFPSNPFYSMRHKLPKPLNLIRSIRALNQGVIFISNEHTAVHAVYPGKVVFSDWLNGYGWLLILDHGKGFMTLYAHNQSLNKHKDEVVTQGEKIVIV